MSDRFMQFVQEQRRQAEMDAAAMTPERDKQRWLEHLQRLDDQVRAWLSEYIEAGAVEVVTEPIVVQEEQVGQYQAPQAKIHVGSHTVKLKPIGAFLIGAYGRVDMEGPRGICRLILVPENANTPRILLNAADRSLDQAVALAWKIATPPPATKYIALTKDTFQDQLMRVVQGA